MPIEKWGGQTIIRQLGHPPLLEAKVEKAVWIWCTPLKESIMLRRHWNKDEGRSTCCSCSPPCATMREDLFGEALVWVDLTTWEVRTGKLSSTAVQQLLRISLTKNRGDELAGLGFQIFRRGTAPNSPCLVEHRHTNPGQLPRFDLAGAVTHHTGIAVSFFGKLDVPDDQVIPPARSRDDGAARSAKPKMPLGLPQRGK